MLVLSIGHMSLALVFYGPSWLDKCWFCWRFFPLVSMVLLIGNWCYSRKWLWTLRAKLCCIASGKWNVNRFYYRDLMLVNVSVAKWIASQCTRATVQNHFSEGRLWIYFSIFFEGSNEEILGRQQKEEVLSWNMGRWRLRGRGLWKSLRLSMCDGPMATVKYMCVNIWYMLDCVVGLAEIHFLGI